jgi:GNAT superfamily N-acetyltransferase
MISYRRMKLSEIERIAEIDRTETVEKAYRQHGSELELIDVAWDIGHWSTKEQLSEWDKYLQKGSVLWGAFEGDLLVGFCCYRPDIAPGMGLLALMYVSAAHRRLGIGCKLTQMLVEHAKETQISSLYVTAEPTSGTVDFYHNLGFRPTERPLLELLKLEPDDIHMRMEFPSPGDGTQSA